MDVVSILKKMKVTDYKFTVDVDGELTTEHPKFYHTINISFNFSGKLIPAEKVSKAVNLSLTRYCGVSAMLSKVAKINSSIIINGEKI